jgi:hypothetical protein
MTAGSARVNGLLTGRVLQILVLFMGMASYHNISNYLYDESRRNRRAATCLLSPVLQVFLIGETSNIIYMML